MHSFLVYGAAAFAEIGGCFAFSASLRSGADVLSLVPGVVLARGIRTAADADPVGGGGAGVRCVWRRLHGGARLDVGGRGRVAGSVRRAGRRHVLRGGDMVPCAAGRLRADPRTYPFGFEPMSRTPSTAAHAGAARPRSERARRIVVKIGSALLADRATGS